MPAAVTDVEPTGPSGTRRASSAGRTALRLQRRRIISIKGDKIEDRSQVTVEGDLTLSPRRSRSDGTPTVRPSVQDQRQHLADDHCAAPQITVNGRTTDLHASTGQPTSLLLFCTFRTARLTLADDGHRRTSRTARTVSAHQPGDGQLNARRHHVDGNALQSVRPGQRSTARSNRCRARGDDRRATDVKINGDGLQPDRG